jgi:hypothetical protein
LATGPGKAMQTKYNGPYVVVSIDKDQSSALIEHMHTGQQVRAHFSNISTLNFLPQYHKAPNRYDEELLQFLPEKYSYQKYYGSKSAKKQSVNKKNIVKATDSNPAPKESKERNSNKEPKKDVVAKLPIVAKNSQNSKGNKNISNEPKNKLLMPSIIKSKDTSTQKIDNNNRKIEIIMPSIIKDINGKINITLPEHILPSQIKKDQIIMPQLLNISTKTLDKDHDKTEMSKERRSTRTKKPPDKLTY